MCSLGFRQFLFLLRGSLQGLLVNCVIVGDVGWGVWSQHVRQCSNQGQVLEKCLTYQRRVITKGDCDSTLPLCIFRTQLMIQLSQYNAGCISRGSVLIPSPLPVTRSQCKYYISTSRLKNASLPSKWFFQCGFLAYFFPLTNSSVLRT